MGRTKTLPLTVFYILAILGLLSNSKCLFFVLQPVGFLEFMPFIMIDKTVFV